MATETTYLLTLDILQEFNFEWSRTNTFTEYNLTQILDR